MLAPLTLVFFKRNGQLYEITEAVAKLVVWNELTHRENIKALVYKKLSGDNVFAEFLSEYIVLNNKQDAYFNIVKVEGEEQYKYSITTLNGKEKEQMELVEYGVFKPNEIRIEANENGVNGKLM